MKKLFLVIFFFVCFEVESKSSNALKLSCEYNQDLIKKEKKDIRFLENEKLDISQISRFIG